MALGAVLLGATGAQAAWFKVETDRFVVYGEGREGAVRDYALKLTTFDAVLRLLHPATRDRVPATKLQLYLVRDHGDLKHIRPGFDRGIAGFYAATNEGVFAVALTGGGLEADDVLFHEYAHHFMLENFPAAYPAWFVEGWAEYFMTADITPKGVKIGGYNEARAYEILLQPWLPMEEVLSKTTAETRRNRRDAYYSQAWLLMHYMRSSPERAAQLNQATAAIAAGEDPVKAFQAATGMDMQQLTKELRGYRKLPVIMIRGALTTPPQMTASRLSPAAGELLLDNLRLLLSPTGAQDPGFLAAVRQRAAKHAGDPFAEMTLARAEFVLGDVAAGEAVAQRLLEAHPEDLEILLLAGTGQVLAGLRDPATREARFRAARPHLGKAYSLDESDFRPLYAYGFARSIEPGFPNDNDLNVLLTARSLAPAVQENSLRAGMALLARGRREEAAQMLAPVVNNPHGGTWAARARALLEGRAINEAAADEDADEAAIAGPSTP